MDVSKIFNNLNEAQRKAVSSDNPCLLVLAGAGSGKTRVIAHRVAWLIEILGVNPQSILTVTFTNKAAKEMRGRIEEIVDSNLGNFWCGTFHGISHRLLRRHWEEANLRKDFSILDSEDQYRVIKRVCRSMEIDTDRWPPRQVQWFINKQKDEARKPSEVNTNEDYFNEKMTSIYLEYEEVCKRESLVDFGELLFRCFTLLKSNKKVLEHYQRHFKYILVDEFQDTNEIQYQFLKILKGNTGQISAVGDDDQSVYGWRGAKSENLTRFSKEFSGSETIKLEQNYRSSQVILDAANTVIRNNPTRMGKELWTDEKEGEPISIYTAFNEEDEAKYVVSSIQSWISGGGSLDETAILYRSNAQSRVLEGAILREGLPYRIYGGLRFYERAEIKNAMAYLRLASGNEDDAAFERAINTPPRGIGAKTMDLVRHQSKISDSSLWFSSEQLIDSSGFTPKALGAVQSFLLAIKKLQQETKELSLRNLVDHVIQMSGLIEFHKKEPGEKGRTRVDNLEELVSAAGEFEMSPGANEEDVSILRQFIDHAALDAGETQASEDESAIQLMTLHSSKGLEFPLVFITGFEEGLFPHQRSIEEAGQLEEERRLCYVGITRSMKKLHFVHAETRNLYGSETFNPPSRFLKEIPSHLTVEVRTGGNIPRKSKTTPSLVQGQVPETDFSLGQRVTHIKFGEGIILNYEGHGANARVQVKFGSGSSKWLMLEFANLSSIN